MVEIKIDAIPLRTDAVQILYTNWRGETALRKIVPWTASGRAPFRFGSTDWHPEPQWLLSAIDVEKDQCRDFALSGIRAWGAEAVAAAPAARGEARQPDSATPSGDGGETRPVSDEVGDLIRTHAFRDLSSPQSITAGISDAADAVLALIASSSGPDGNVNAFAAALWADMRDRCALDTLTEGDLREALGRVWYAGLSGSAGTISVRDDVQCHCVGSLGPNPECGACGGSGCIAAEVPTPPDLIQAAREAAAQAAVSIVEWMMCEGLMRHRTAEDDGILIEGLILNTMKVAGLVKDRAAPTTGGEAPGRDDPKAWRDVMAERRRQTEVEGWTQDHDDAHDEGELARAAAAYARHAGSDEDSRQVNSGYAPEDLWPWTGFWKPSSRRRDLVKAGALILAEIERLDRLSAPPRSSQKEEGV